MEASHKLFHSYQIIDAICFKLLGNNGYTRKEYITFVRVYVQKKLKPSSPYVKNDLKPKSDECQDPNTL